MYALDSLPHFSLRNQSLLGGLKFPNLRNMSTSRNPGVSSWTRFARLAAVRWLWLESLYTIYYGLSIASTKIFCNLFFHFFSKVDRKQKIFEFYPIYNKENIVYQSIKSYFTCIFLINWFSVQDDPLDSCSKYFSTLCTKVMCF